jgi:hypothetical protein
VLRHRVEPASATSATSRRGEAGSVRADLRANESIGDFIHGDRIPVEGRSFATGLSHGEDEYGVGILLIGKLGLDGIDRA